ncbi:hypothetical protein M2405_004189 [Rhodococcus erythropolis]|uniref:hypothetical protein n=1 Tax=Rhodococcus erythropolis TaxID=1833 RepID=UPI002167D5E6|nr:hypothetical protein [Rhodococcus erythropolis]MCS4255886.1 hypothetical protein [Rhodococcus erythropolis]MCW2425403.1 hypothetical protein [Rhodococcus erythropolis]
MGDHRLGIEAACRDIDRMAPVREFDTAAREAGFDSPPLPDLRAAENPMRSELTTV